MVSNQLWGVTPDLRPSEWQVVGKSEKSTLDFYLIIRGVEPELSRDGLQCQGVGVSSEQKDLQLRLEEMALKVSTEQDGDGPSPGTERQV